LRALKFLHLCDYSVDDICSILAHASSYFGDVYVLCGSHMDPVEVGNILVTLMFVAHCYVQDETCPLHVWHKHLFRKYCPLSKLSAAVLRLMEIRGYVLRLDLEELGYRYGQMRLAAPQPVWEETNIGARVTASPGSASSSSGQQRHPSSSSGQDTSVAAKSAEEAAAAAASAAAAAEAYRNASAEASSKAKDATLWGRLMDHFTHGS